MISDTVNSESNGRIALVTGASRGIGQALSLGLARHGFDIAMMDLTYTGDALDANRQKIEDMGRRAFVYHVDVSRKAEVGTLIDRVIADAGGIDLLVNNAGVLKLSLLEDLEEDEWDRHFAVNAKGVFLMCQAVTPHMKARGTGRIVNVASIAGRLGVPNQGHYAATKAAVISLTRVLARELGPHGITVNAICPGIIMTEMGRNNLGDEQMVKYWEGQTALRRLGQPEDLVGAVYFFASPHADFITGQSINVDGGIYFH
jgi:3-oxoacyl-[acyl-carrier protein] reductase